MCKAMTTKLTYNKNQGVLISNSDLNLIFGTDRKLFRDYFHYEQSKNRGRNDNEDSYPSILKDTWFRLSFVDNILDEIEILNGSVYVDNCEIKIGGTLDKTITNLCDKGFSFIKGERSYTDFNNLFDIGDSEENGGETNKIAWFYTAKNIDHLKE